MGTYLDHSKKLIEKLSSVTDFESLIKRAMSERQHLPDDKKLPLEASPSEEGKKEKWQFLKEETNCEAATLVGDEGVAKAEHFRGNIENFIGVTQIPTGIMGPLHVIGTAANGDFYVPMATTEGALLASYHRGARAARLAGGIISVCLVEGVKRSPVFRFNNLGELAQFVMWILNEVPQFEKITNEISNYACLKDINTHAEGNQLILTFEYTTGDAAGQNMVTLCTDGICQYIVANAPVKPKEWYIEGNYSGDKKATAVSFSSVRGRKVTAEVTIPHRVVEEVLKTTAAAMAQYWQTSTIGVIQSGAIGAQGHIANGLAAIFIATGQDAACVSEAAVGITRMEHIPEKGLYASITLPNLIVGTVGGGTGLPTQRECLQIMDCVGKDKARKFAEICGAAVLAGELSIAAALSAGHFSSAHEKFGRTKKQ